MRKSVDFSVGVRGKHTGMDLKVLGVADCVWAVCVTKDSKDLIPFKLYRIETFSDSDEVRSKNEKGVLVYYPKAWFAPVEVSKKTLGLLERAA
jgi:hypothetical protein